MDQDRQIRFLIPPFSLIGSLFLGAKLNGIDLSSAFKPEMAKDLLGLLAATAVLILPMGFLIGVISVTLLRIIAVVLRQPTHEVYLSHSTLARIWEQIRTSMVQDRNLALYAAVTFDHELLAPGIHSWLMRRWNAFNTACGSVVALALALCVAPLFSLRRVLPWTCSTVVLAAVLLAFAIIAWRETMKMVEFQSFRRHQSSKNL